VRRDALFARLPTARGLWSTLFLLPAEARLGRLSLLVGDRANRLPGEIQTGLLGDKRAQVGRLSGIALHNIMEHPLRSHDALLKVMVNADFERMNLLGVSEKGLGIFLMQLVVERGNLGSEALIEPLTLPPFGCRLSLGCHDLAPSSTGLHG
jgi:hypothetical protein